MEMKGIWRIVEDELDLGLVEDELDLGLETWYCPEHHLPTFHCWNGSTDVDCWDLWYELRVWR